MNTYVLDGINAHPYLKNRFVLKGGTALNLFFFDLPRLSVDIDLNYIGQVNREEMLQERPLIEQGLEAVFRRTSLSIRRFPERHAEDKWQLRYQSALGGFGNLEVDVNFMFRISFCDVKKLRSHVIGNRQIHSIATLDIHELGAGKITALFSRRASRDLFDTHELLTQQALEIDRLRLLCILYGVMGNIDWRKISFEEIHFDTNELKNQLVPVLRKRAFGSVRKELVLWADKMVASSKKALELLLLLQAHELEFLNRFFDHGELDASLLTEDKVLNEKIHNHPLLKWKAHLVAF